MFAPDALASEASAMLAADVAFSTDERVRARTRPAVSARRPRGRRAAAHIDVERLVGELQIVQADVARRYLDGELEFARAVAELEERALVPHAEAQIKYINEFRSYVTTYTTGRAALPRGCLHASVLRQPTVAARWRCF